MLMRTHLLLQLAPAVKLFNDDISFGLLLDYSHYNLWICTCILKLLEYKENWQVKLRKEKKLNLL